MMGTGLKKCMPQTFSGLRVAAAISVSDMDDVLDARITWGGQSSSNSLKTLFFRSKFSMTASMTKSTSFRSAISVVPLILPRMASF